MHVHRLTTVAVRQRNHLVRDLLVAATGAVLMTFYISAFTSAMETTTLAREVAAELAPSIALVDRAR